LEAFQVVLVEHPLEVQVVQVVRHREVPMRLQQEPFLA